MDSMSKVPVQTRLTGYIKSGELFEKIFHQEINYFNFRSLSYEEKVLDVFDITDCISDPNNRKYFDLYVQYDGKKHIYIVLPLFFRFFLSCTGHFGTLS